MKNVVLLALVLGLVLSGCGLELDKTYVSVTPHKEETPKEETDIIHAENYRGLRTALLQFIAQGSESGRIGVSDYNKTDVDSDIQKAIDYAIHNDPIGCFAVDQITYEIGTSSGRSAVAVNITYLHDRTEIRQIQPATNMEAAGEAIYQALDLCNPGLVLNIDNYQPMDIAQLVEDYAGTHPDKVMELPQVAVSVYPEQGGSSRVVEVKFTYQTSRDTLRVMQEQVGRIFTSASLYISSNAGEHMKFTQLFSFLIERNDYKFETSLTPAYSLLHHGVGDSKAFATVYAAMCTQAGLDCRVVSGTRDGESWYWNIIFDDGIYYHVDLVECNRLGYFQRLGDAAMEGYVWNYSMFPVCGVEVK